MDDFKSSQFHEYEQKSILCKINSSNIYIDIYIDLFYVKAGKKIFVEEMMGGVLKRHKKQFLGEIGARRVAGQISLKIWISSMTK